MLKSIEVRNKFCNFFNKKNHKILPSFSLLPKDDPSLLFINAGMAPLKNFFLGKSLPPSKNIVTIQKCLRISGKHNDLENVGQTPKHHTFFEMMGNFSFGGYFKETACELAWEFLTKEMEIPQEKLWIAMVEEDDEVFKIWHHKIGIPQERIKKYPLKDLFWEMGEIGPCGSCTEIHYDYEIKCKYKNIDCGPLCDCGRFLEIWNIVFQEKEKTLNGQLISLPQKNIDTGMGFERLCALVQNCNSNFEIDIIKPLIIQVAEMSKLNYGENNTSNIAMRVIVDHIRTLVFAIADGIYPANIGQGYVLRKLLRRAVKYGKHLNLDKSFLYLLVPSVIELMKNPYDQLIQAKKEIVEVILREEENFEKTLSKGKELFEKYKSGDAIFGKEIYYYYDTLGIPMDLMEEIAIEKSLKLDKEDFSKIIAEQKNLSRNITKNIQTKIEELDPKIKNLEKSVFKGYELDEIETEVIAILKKNTLVEEICDNEKIGIILKETPFYAEEGGQISDKGIIEGNFGKVEVEEVKEIFPDIFSCFGKVIGKIKSGEKVKAKIDTCHRHEISANHTTTHILHSILKTVLGDHVRQAGSLVTENKLRFDFTHFEAIDKKNLFKIEELVNEEIKKNTKVEILEMSFTQAKEQGSIALFEKKYKDFVRVVKIGSLSMELCGGTHLKNTQEIGLFKIVQETNIAAGIRRIEALTGKLAYKCFREKEEKLSFLLEELEIQENNLFLHIKKLKEEHKNLIKENNSLKNKLLLYSIQELLDKIQTINGIKVLSIRKDLDNVSMKFLIDKLMNEIKDGIIVLGSIYENKINLMVKVSLNLSEKISANELIKKIAFIFESKGGGNSIFAQAGGGNLYKLDDALNSVQEIIKTSF
ncbi:MAG: alanine--tRNA ligase [bacterium]